MQIFKKILIEVDEAALNYRPELYVVYKHDNSKVIGYATPYNEDNKLYADLEIFDHIKNAEALIPSVGIAYVGLNPNKGTICSLSLGGDNVDPNIKCIGEQLTNR